MVTLERLDELEGRILRALELISDLRTENSRLDESNNQLQTENNNLKQTLVLKDQEVAKLRTQIESTSSEFKELKSRETALETKINDMFNKLNSIQNIKISGQGQVTPKTESVSNLKQQKVNEYNDFSSAEQTVKNFENDLDESIVIIKDDLPPTKTKTSIEKTTFVPQAPTYKDNLKDDDDIIFIDDEDDGFKVENIDDHNGEKNVISHSNDEEHLGIFDSTDDDDFLIIEENDKQK